MDHRGILDVTGVEWENDEGTFYISNYGNGVVTNIELITLAYTPSGDHRKYSWMRKPMTRKDKQGELANALQPKEEDKPFEGKSQVGSPIPQKFPDRWNAIDFSLFILQMREVGVEQVKYLHVVKGSDLSGNRCLGVVYLSTRSINPQEFKQQHSLGDMPSPWRHGHDETFQRYLKRPLRDKIKRRIYHRSVQLFNLNPFFKVSRRDPDTSGFKLVRHIIIWRNVVNRLKNPRETAHWLKEKIPLIERLPSIGQ